MNASSSVTVTHGLTLSKIRYVSAIVRNDANTELTPLDGFVSATGPSQGGVAGIGSTQLTLIRLVSGHFDNTNYNGTEFIRGYVLIHHMR